MWLNHATGTIRMYRAKMDSFSRLYLILLGPPEFPVNTWKNNHLFMTILSSPLRQGSQHIGEERCVKALKKGCVAD